MIQKFYYRVCGILRIVSEFFTWTNWTDNDAFYHAPFSSLITPFIEICNAKDKNHGADNKTKKSENL